MIPKNLLVSIVCFILFGMLVRAGTNNAPSLATAPPPASSSPSSPPPPAPAAPAQPQSQPQADPNVVIVKVGASQSWLESFMNWIRALIVAIPFTAILSAIIFFTIIIYIYLYMQRRMLLGTDMDVIDNGRGEHELYLAEELGAQESAPAPIIHHHHYYQVGSQGAIQARRRGHPSGTHPSVNNDLSNLFGLLGSNGSQYGNGDDRDEIDDIERLERQRQRRRRQRQRQRQRQRHHAHRRQHRQPGPNRGMDPEDDMESMPMNASPSSSNNMVAEPLPVITPSFTPRSNVHSRPPRPAYPIGTASDESY